MDEIDAALGTFLTDAELFSFFFSEVHLIILLVFQTSRMFPSSDITSRIGQRMHSL